VALPFKINYPIEAIEEALVNAVYHRDYGIREPVEVRITPEELTITSYPGPDRSITSSALRKRRFVSRRYRNRRIEEFLKELDLTEGRGTGIPKILRAIRENHSPEPQFETNHERSFFTVTFPAHPKTKEARPVAEVTPLVTPPVTKLIQLLNARGALGNADVRKELGLKDRVHMREHYISPALAQGMIERTIPDKPNSRLQKYRLTPLGKALLAH